MVLGLLLIGSFFFKPTVIQASGLAFQVVPITPANQRPQAKGYFDFIASAGSETILKIKLKNVTNKSVQVNINPASMQTSNNGVLDYSMSQKKDQTLAYDVAKLIKGDKSIVIPANSSVIYTAKLEMPAQKYNGIIAGGLVLTSPSAPVKTQKGQIGITNRFSYAVPVIARNENKTWLPMLQLTTSKILQVDYRNQLQIRVNNPSPTFVNQLRIEQVATNLATKKVYRKTTSNLQMAPNSHFYYRLALPEKVPAGTYQVKTTAYYVKNQQGDYLAGNQQHYQYRQQATNQVVLTKQQARKLNREITKAKSGGYRWLIYAIIAGVTLLILIIIGLLIYIWHSKKRHPK